MARRLQAVLLRLATPGESKLGHSRKMSKDAGVEVEEFYRMMDAVTDDGVQATYIRSNVGTAWGKINGALF